jgi:NADH:ubiquinone oxidoreductase subunit K
MSAMLLALQGGSLPELPETLRAAPSGEIAAALLISALLLAVGVVGFLSRRNMIIMFLCTELMFQGAALAMVAFSRHHMDVSGQVFVIFILTVGRRGSARPRARRAAPPAPRDAER